jgi:hypothetical protein
VRCCRKRRAYLGSRRYSHNRIIVGFYCRGLGDSCPLFPSGNLGFGCGFVYSNGSTFILNDLLSYPASYTLIDALDINDFGQIVGTAEPTTQTADGTTVPSGQGFYVYVATPQLRFVPWPIRWPVSGWPWYWRPPGWAGPITGPPWPGYSGSLSAPLSPEVIAATREQASRMRTTGKGSSPLQLQTMLDAHRARLFRLSALRRKRLSRRRASPRRRKRKA